MSVAHKRLVIAGEQQGSVLARCRALDLSRSSYYYQPTGETGLNLELMRLMDLEFTEHCFQGVLGMRNFLRLEKGYWVNEKRVRRLLRLMGLEAVAPKPDLSKPAKGHKIHPYLLRGVTIDGPDHVWSTDITYIAMGKGFLYLTAVMDCTADTCSPGRSATRWTHPSASKPCTEPFCNAPLPASSTPTKAASTPVKRSPMHCSRKASGSAWTARDAQPTTLSLSGSGEALSSNAFTATAPPMGSSCEDCSWSTSLTTTTAGRTRTSMVSRRHICTLAYPIRAIAPSHLTSRNPISN